MIIRHIQKRFVLPHFSLQSYCTDRTASTALLMSSPQKGSLPKSQILGIPVCALPFACLIGLLMQSVNARKIDFPTSEADKASIQGKKINFNSNGYESKKTDKGARRAVGHQPFPEFPQDWQRKRYEKPLLRQGSPVSSLWQLHLQCDKQTEYL